MGQSKNELIIHLPQHFNQWLYSLHSFFLEGLLNSLVLNLVIAEANIIGSSTTALKKTTQQILAISGWISKLP